jgi:diguanylate cyclase (GGDEF)-like protein/PAS domain S-box-containing protein
MMKEEERPSVRLTDSLASQTDMHAAAEQTQFINTISKTGFDLSHLDSDRLLKAILETTQDGFIVINQDGSIKYANDSYLKLTGYSRSELETLKLNDLIPADKRGVIHEARELILNKGTALFETVDKKKDGSLYHVEVSATCLSRAPFITVCFIRDITDRKNAEQSLLHSHDLMRYIIEHNRSAVAVHDKNLNYMYVSRPYMEVFRVRDENPIGKYHYDVFPDLPMQLREVHKRVLRGEIVTCEEEEYFYDDGSSNWMRWECRPWYETDDSIGGIVLYSEIITERKLIEQALYNEKEHFKMTLLSVGDGVISADKHGTITVMNPIAEKLTGWQTAQALGQPLQDVLRVIHEDTRAPNEDYLEKVMAAGSIIDLSNGLLLLSKEGKEIPVEVGAAPIRDSKGDIVGVVIVIRDYTEKKIKQKEIEYLSYHDPLTGLYNRRYMEDSIKRLDVSRNIPLTLMVLDVNGLKLTNDAFGHEAGDQLLIKFAAIMRKVCRADDIVGRMGGDEFCILLPHTDEKQAESIKERIKTAASNLKLDPIVLSLAVGHAAKTSPEQAIETVMTEADNLMYKDKIKYGKMMRSQTIEMVLHHINANYEQEQIHTQNVSRYCEAIAKAMGLSKKEVSDIRNAAALHDIGKIMVPPQILNKPGKLTQEELTIIRRHPEIGYQMLKSVDEYVILAEYVLHHHERWDGSGYPEGLRGDNIPLYSRIIAVADAYEAMTAVRPYQKSKTKEEAILELLRCSSIQFDPDIVRVFVEKILSVRNLILNS